MFTIDGAVTIKSQVAALQTLMKSKFIRVRLPIDYVVAPHQKPGPTKVEREVAAEQLYNKWREIWGGKPPSRRERFFMRLTNAKDRVVAAFLILCGKREI